MKILITVAVTLVVTAGIFIAYGHWSKAGAKTVAEPMAVRIERVALSELVEVVSAPGTIQPRNKVSISAKVAARVIELPFKEGDVVTKGAATTKPSLLVRLDARDLESALRSTQAHYAAEAAQIIVAKARIESARAGIAASRVMLADAERDLKRQSGLLGSKDVSQAVVEQAQAKVDQLAAQMQASVHSLAADEANIGVLDQTLKAAEADVQKAADELTYTLITSPIDGTVTRLNAKVGELVVTGILDTPGTVIMEIGDLSQMVVEARVDESSIALVEKGQETIVRSPAYPDRIFHGAVTEVDLANTEDKTDNTKYFKVKVLLDTKGDRLFCGVSADVDIETTRHPKVVKVPSQAVLGRAADDLPEEVRNTPNVNRTKALATVVYREVNGKAVITPVAVGPSDATHTLIQSGLKPGDRVIVGPYKVLDSLSNGQAVAPAPGGPATTRSTE